MRTLLTGKRLLPIAGIALLFLSFWVIGQFVDFEKALQPERLAALLRETGTLAPLVLIVTMAVAVVVSPIPSLPLDLAAGATFGPFLGTTYAVLGAEIGAIISFLIARALGRELLSKLLRREVVFCEKCSDRHLMILLVVARLLPVFSFDVISYGAGLTNVSLKVFALATLVGMIPPTFALTYLGSSVVTVQWPLILAGIVMVALLLLAPQLVIRYPSTWWARLLLAAAPVSTRAAAVESRPSHPDESARPCSGCGGSLPSP